jgi:hypothetical protein
MAVSSLFGGCVCVDACWFCICGRTNTGSGTSTSMASPAWAVTCAVDSTASASGDGFTRFAAHKGRHRVRYMQTQSQMCAVRTFFAASTCTRIRAGTWTRASTRKCTHLGQSHFPQLQRTITTATVRTIKVCNLQMSANT